MGTWGPGNFQNDGALDYVAEIVESLVGHIMECFRSTKADPDELGESELVPSVAILATLCEHCNAVPPEKELIRLWKRRYLASWDVYASKQEPDDLYRLGRREVIAATFDRLEALAKF